MVEGQKHSIFGMVTAATFVIPSMFLLSSSLYTIKAQQQSVIACKMKRMAFASPSVPPPPPISMPVWSLATPIPTSLRSDTAAPIEAETSMNIITFATPVSVAPPKLWAVSLYNNTLTRDAFLQSKVAVLQLLSPSQKHLVHILGKRSGYEANYFKRQACAELIVADVNDADERTMEWIKHGGSADDDDDAFILHEDRIGALKPLDLLPGCASYIQLKLISVTEAGDHDVAFCEVVRTGFWDKSKSKVVVASVNQKEASLPKDTSTVLYTGQLREEGLI